MSEGDRHFEEAVQWVARVRTEPDVDWEALTAWLEAEPANRAAFNELSLLDSDLPAVQPANDDGRGLGRRDWKWLRVAPAAAAMLAAAGVAFVMLRPGPSTMLRFETRPGEQRTVALADGTTIALNGSTVLTLKSRSARSAHLEKGEAYFDVVHDAKRPFEVQLGNAAIQDVGTSFDVVREQGTVEVSVSDGAVAFRSGPSSLKVSRGMVLRVDGASGRLSKLAPDGVAGWREGELVYDHAPLSRIAADLQRSRGLRVDVSPDLSGREFTGTIQLDSNGDVLVGRVAALLGVEAVKTRSGWQLAPARR